MSSIEDLASRIRILDEEIQQSGSPMFASLVHKADSEQPSGAECVSPSSVVDGPHPEPQFALPEWQPEWPRLRLEELKLGRQAVRDEAAVMRADSPASWSERNAMMIGWQREVGWSEEQAIAYTCISLGGPMALAQARREGSDRFSGSEQLLRSVLSERAAASGEISPPVYRHLSGKFSLCSVDPAWTALLQPDAAPGLTFTTSALTIATDDEQCFDAKGYRVRLTTAKKLFYEPQNSDVVCFRGDETELVADTRSAAETRTVRSFVQVSETGWHLPPQATVTLEQIVPPGEWSAYGRKVARRLLVCRVAFTC